MYADVLVRGYYGLETGHRQLEATKDGDHKRDGAVMTLRMTDESMRKDLAAVAAGYTLPSWFYTDPEVYALERSFVFGSSWQFAVHEDSVPSPGTYAMTRLGDQEVIVSRDKDGLLRAFRNVCLHRGSRLLRVDAPSGSSKTSIQCAYHGWTYGLDGRLLGAPGCGGDERVSGANIRMEPLDIHSEGPLLFVRIGQSRVRCDEVLSAYRRMSIDWNELSHRETRSYTYRCNWKIAFENACECYHCPTAHPGLADLVDLRRLSVTVDSHSFETRTTRKPSAAVEGAYLTLDDAGENRQYSHVVRTWPNMLFTIYPGRANLTVARWLPDGVDRTVCVRTFFFATDASHEEFIDFVRYVEEIQAQDIELCENVQANMTNGAFGRGLIRLTGQAGTAEHGVQLVQKLLLEALLRREGSSAVDTREIVESRKLALIGAGRAVD